MLRWKQQSYNVDLFEFTKMIVRHDSDSKHDERRDGCIDERFG